MIQICNDPYEISYTENGVTITIKVAAKPGVPSKTRMKNILDILMRGLDAPEMSEMDKMNQEYAKHGNKFGKS